MLEIENLFGRFNNRLNIIDEGISDLKDRAREINPTETHREK